MINIENLNKHTDKIGGIPSDDQNFTEYFEEEAIVIAGVLHIPAATIGPFSFAPATYDERTKTWHHTKPETYEDELTEIFANRTKLLANDYDLRALSNVCDHVMEV